MSDVEEACGHERCHSYMWNGTCWCVVAQWFHGTHTTRVDAVTCDDCGAWLSLGPANDLGEHAAAVACEIRAAELAQAWKPEGGIVGVATFAERVGWLLWPHEAPRTVDENAGWLASQIQNHRMDGHNIAGAEYAAKVAATHDPREEQG